MPSLRGRCMSLCRMSCDPYLKVTLHFLQEHIQYSPVKYDEFGYGILPAIANNTIVCNAAYGGYASQRLARAV